MIRTRIGVIAAALAGFLVAACSGGTAATDSPTASLSSASATATATSTAAPHVAAGTPTASLTPPSTGDEPTLAAGWVDLHNHGAPGPLLGALQAVWREQGVGTAVVFIPAEVDEPEFTAQELTAAVRVGNLLPYLDPSEIPFDRYTADTLREALEPMLASGQFVGLGEIVLGTITPYAQQALPTHPTLDGLWDLAAEYHLLVSLHVDPDPEYLASMEELLARRDDVTFVWAHMGIAGFPRSLVDGGEFGSPAAYFANVERLLEVYPNLYVDLSTGDPENTFSVNPLDARWVEIVEAYPTRFLWGTDFAPSKEYAGLSGSGDEEELSVDDAPAIIAAYEADMATYRAWLAVLDPDVAVRVQRENAVTLLAAR